MGSPYFYLEPLLALCSLLKLHYRNPAIFALEYSLVPTASYPTQVEQTTAGYAYALARAGHLPSRLCVAGDSAGATLVLSLLLCLANDPTRRPAFAALISPWTTLGGALTHDTASDYLGADALHAYAALYAGGPARLHDPQVSPGECVARGAWAAAAPEQGVYVTWGSEEVLAAETRAWVRRLRADGVPVVSREEPGAVHAWVIASLFLEDERERRIFGMRELAEAIARNVGGEVEKKGVAMKSRK